MKLFMKIVTCLMFAYFGQTTVFASNFPDGALVIHNASQKQVTASVSSVGQFQLESNEKKSVTYQLLAFVCAATPTHCLAHFYVDRKPAGSAIINTVTGKLVKMKKLPVMKVRMIQGSQNVLRSVVIY